MKKTYYMKKNTCLLYEKKNTYCMKKTLIV